MAVLLALIVAVLLVEDGLRHVALVACFVEAAVAHARLARHFDRLKFDCRNLKRASKRQK